MNKKFYCNQCKKEVEILEERVDEHGYLFKVLSCEHETAREVNVRDKGIGSDEFRITKVVEDDHVVEEKLKAAEYFLNELKKLEKESSNLASADLSLVLVNLDGFLFEAIAAKDIFLQEINRNFNGGMPSNKVNEERLIDSEILEEKAKNVVIQIKQVIRNQNSWLWRLNNYRNATAHRSILKITTEAVKTIAVTSDLERPNQLQSYNDYAYGKSENSSFPPSTNAATLVAVHLAEDPDDSSNGYFNKEIIPYCEEVLEQMKNFLADLKNQL
jgi:hypothetical protein